MKDTCCIPIGVAAKNHQRFNFGVLYPRATARRRQDQMRGACRPSAWFRELRSPLEVNVRFLQIGRAFRSRVPKARPRRQNSF